MELTVDRTPLPHNPPLPSLQLRMEILTMHLDEKPAGGVALKLATGAGSNVDGLNASNACGLAEEDLKARVVENIDIGSAPVSDFHARHRVGSVY